MELYAAIRRLLRSTLTPLGLVRVVALAARDSTNIMLTDNGTTRTLCILQPTAELILEYHYARRSRKPLYNPIF